MATSGLGVAGAATSPGTPLWSGNARGLGYLGKTMSGGSSGATKASDLDDAIDRILQIQQNNNAWSANQAAIQRDWQVQQNQKAMEFSASEAAKNRDWQEMMSNTAHQREVQDLMAAGLNPILSAMGGNGAAVTSGATASGVTSSGAKGDTDSSASGAIASLFGAFLSAQTQLQAMNTNAVTNMAVVEKQTEMQKYIAELSSKTQLTTANISSATSKWVADLQSKTNISTAQVSAAASKIAAEIHAAASRYGADMSYWSQDNVARVNSDLQKELKQMGIDAEINLKEMFPETVPQLLGSVNSYLDNPVGQFADWLLGRDSFDGFGNSGKSFAEAARGGGFYGGAGAK